MLTQTTQPSLDTANPQTLEECGKKLYDEKKYLESLSGYAKASKIHLSTNELNHFHRVIRAIKYLKKPYIQKPLKKSQLLRQLQQ